MLEKAVFIIAGLGFGDETKGMTMGCLTNQFGIHTIVLGGAAQRGHHRNGHTFCQFGSGMFTPDVFTHLPKRFIVHPQEMFREERELQQRGVTDAFDRMAIHRDALVISPYQQAANRLREISLGPNSHGSVGRGVRDTRSDYLELGDRVLFARDLADPVVTRRKLKFLRDLKLEQFREVIAKANRVQAIKDQLWVFRPDILEGHVELFRNLSRRVQIVDDSWLEARLNQPGIVGFEGGQGVLLDEDFGFSPHVTWSRTGFTDPLEMLEGYEGEIVRLGLLRTYLTRHGKGPFVTEEASLNEYLPEPNNPPGQFTGPFRVGYLDLVALRYALEVTNGADFLGLSHLDRLTDLPEWRVCEAYSCNAPDRDQYFTIKNGLVTAIKVQNPLDLAARERLTQLLFQCKPVYETIPRTDEAAYLAYIEEALGIPIAIAGHGTTDNDRVLLRPLLSSDSYSVVSLRSSVEV